MKTLRKSMIRNAIVMSLILLVSCDGQKKDSDLETRLNKLEQENEKLKEKLENTPETTNSGIPYNSEPASTSYVFTRLIVEQEEYASPNAYTKVPVEQNYCSMIKEFPRVDSDLKYRLMDEIQSRYLSSPVAQLKHGKVKNRECFVFATYEEASKKREEFIVDKE